jgi:ABC-type transport system involved in multi-copper enzyme maturation permease subunit
MSTALATPATSPTRWRSTRAEWAKVATSRGTLFSYALLLGLTVAIAAFAASGSSTNATVAGDDDIVMMAVAGAFVGQIVAVVIGAMAFGGEYGSGMIAATFAATPRRLRAFAAKAAIVWIVVTLVSVVAAFASFFVVRPIQRGNGYVAPAYPDPDLTSEPVLRAILGTGLLLGLIAVIAVGVGAILKKSSLGITISLAVLIAPFLLLPNGWTRSVQRWSPMAGFSIQQTVVRNDTIRGPWTGLAVTAIYAIAVIVIAAIVTNRRDI